MFRSSPFRFALAIGLALLPSGATAEMVELRSSDGLIAVEGEIRSVEGGMITLDTVVGPMRIAAASVGCFGAACPDELRPAPEARTAVMGFSDAAQIDSFRSALATLSPADVSAEAIDVTSPNTITLAPLGDGDPVALTLLEPGSTDEATVTLGTSAVSGAGGFISPGDWSDDSGRILLATNVTGYKIIASRNTGVEALSLRDIGRIYAGDVKNWSELGGNDVPIQALRPSPRSAMHGDVEAMVLNPFGLRMNPGTFAIQGADQAASMMKTVPGMIKVVPVDSAIGAHEMTVLDACGAPTFFTPMAANSGQYPLATVTSADIGDRAYAPVLGNVLAAWANRNGLMAAGDADAAKSARISGLLSTAQAPSDAASARDFVQLLLGTRQFPAVFDPDASSDGLAALYRTQFTELARLLATGEIAASEIIFAGFASRSDAAADLGGSAQSAANAVSTAFASFLDATGGPTVTVTARGFGGIAASFCGADGSADLARRVEVWIRPTAG